MIDTKGEKYGIWWQAVIVSTMFILLKGLELPTDAKKAVGTNDWILCLVKQYTIQLPFFCYFFTFNRTKHIKNNAIFYF
jgi:hypothetical protein